MRRGDAKGNEAVLKFFLFGVLSSALMLYGMSLVYGVTGTTVLSEIREAIAVTQAASEPIVVLAVFFLLVGFAFKISAVPFHFWAPDTYEGAPSPVAAFLSTASKVGGFVGLLVLMFEAFPAVADTWRPLFAILAVLTMTVGNLVALRQQHIIRLLAYASLDLNPTGEQKIEAVRTPEDFDRLIAGEDEILSRKVTILSGQNLVRGAVLGKIKTLLQAGALGLLVLPLREVDGVLEPVGLVVWWVAVVLLAAAVAMTVSRSIGIERPSQVPA